MQLGEQLKTQREKLQMTQQDLAERLHVTRQTVSRWENNTTYPNLDTLVDISDVLSISLDDLLKGDDAKVVTEISHDVKTKNRYKKFTITIGAIFGLIILGLGILSYGRGTQNDTIDRINPFLSTTRGFAVLPQKTPTKMETVTETNVKGHSVKRRTAVPQPVTAYVVENGFGGGEWLTFSVGEVPSKGMNYAYVQHKGSYVSQATLIRRNDVPKLIRTQLGDYHAYDKRYDWPKSSWSPF